MRLLLDSHTLLWAIDAPEKLGPLAEEAMSDPANELWISVGTLWEVGIKVGTGKLKLSLPYRQWMTGAIADLNLSLLPITLDVAEAQSGLPYHHRDPFDRLLIAHALVGRLPIVSIDDKFDACGVARIW